MEQPFTDPSHPEHETTLAVLTCLLKAWIGKPTTLK